MPKYYVKVEIEVEANSEEEAWGMVAAPFHNGELDQPLWLNPLVGEPEVERELDNSQEVA